MVKSILLQFDFDLANYGLDSNENFRTQIAVWIWMKMISYISAIILTSQYKTWPRIKIYQISNNFGKCAVWKNRKLIKVWTWTHWMFCASAPPTFHTAWQVSNSILQNTQSSSWLDAYSSDSSSLSEPSLPVVCKLFLLSLFCLLFYNKYAPTLLWSLHSCSTLFV